MLCEAVCSVRTPSNQRQSAEVCVCVLAAVAESYNEQEQLVFEQVRCPSRVASHLSCLYAIAVGYHLMVAYAVLYKYCIIGVQLCRGCVSQCGLCVCVCHALCS